MPEYVAGRGTTALGVVGTVLGSIGTAASLGNGVLGLSGQNAGVCLRDLESERIIAQKDAEIAQLTSERYTDAAKAEAREYTTQATIDIYKELKADINGIKMAEAEKWGAQGVVNANVNATLATLGAQQQNSAATLAAITKIGIPQSAICAGSGGCQCSNI